MIQGWNEMPLGLLPQIEEINKMNVSDDEKILRQTALLADMPFNDFENLPLNKARELISQTGWLLEEPKAYKAKKKYKLGDTTYRLQADMSDMSVAQYMDYQAAGESGNICRLMALVLIPEGAKHYAEDYDTEKVAEDAAQYLTVTEALGIKDFFYGRFRRLLGRLNRKVQTMLKVAQITAPKKDNEKIQALTLSLRLALEDLISAYGSL